MEVTAIVAEVATAVLEWAPAIAAHVKVQFSGMAYSSSPMLLHSVLTLFARFPDAFGAEDERKMARRLASAACEAHRPLPVRLLVLHWLLGSGRFRDSVPGLAKWFYPGMFDPLALKAKKLDCLGFVAATVDSDKVEGGSYGRQTTELIDDGLVCVSAFRWLPAWSTETGVAFRALHRVLVGAAPHGTNDKGCSGAGELLNSTTFHHFQAMLVDMASEHRSLVPVIADFINRLLACTTHRWVGEQLLRTVDECLLPRLEPGYQLASYYPLFEKIAQNEAVPQLRLIELLTKQMVCLAKKHDPDTELKSWSQGSKVVGICRIMLKHHHSSHIFLPLTHLLVRTIESFPDLEIRDHARICLRMLSCIPGKKLRNLMGIGEQPTPSHPGSMFDDPSERPAQDPSSMPALASYIHLERVVPLVVKQSWALTLPNFSFQSRASGHIISIQDVSVTPPEQEKPLQPTIERIGYTQEALRVMDSKGAETLEILRRHFSCIPDYLHSTGGLKVKIHCTFRFDSEPFNRAWVSDSPVPSSEGEDELPALYAVTISLSSSAQFGKIPSCHVPFLLGEPPASGVDIVPIDNCHQEESSYHASVMIELEPREPSPGLIDVEIAANTENCQVICGSLQPITVGIEDMFLKASVPPDTPKDGAADYYQDLFHALWEACNSSSNTGRETFPLSGGKGLAAISGTRSVKLLEVTPKVLIGALERYLAPFVVSVAGRSLITILRGNGVIENVVWEESDSDAAVGADALVPYSMENNLQLQHIDDDEIGIGAQRFAHLSKRDMGVVSVLIFLPPRGISYNHFLNKNFPNNPAERKWSIFVHWSFIMNNVRLYAETKFALYVTSSEVHKEERSKGELMGVSGAVQWWGGAGELMGVSGAVQWWEVSQLRILVLASLVIQYILLVASAASDAIAIYALATLFNRHRESHQEDGDGGSNILEVLWAPILLIHLGGQDGITAYNIEDNELWTRHILTSVSQKLKIDLLEDFIHKAISPAGANDYLLTPATPVDFTPHKLFVDVASPSPDDRIRMLQSFSALDDNHAYCKLQHWLSETFQLLYTKEKMFSLEFVFVGQTNNIAHARASMSEQIVGFFSSGLVRLFAMYLPFAAVALFHCSHREVYREDDVKVTYVLLCCTAALEGNAMFLKSLRRGRENRKQTDEPLFADMVSQYNLIGLLVRNKKHSRMMRILGVLGCSAFLQQHWRMKSCYSSFSITMLVLKYVKGGWEHHIRDVSTYRKFSDNRGQFTLGCEGCYEELGWSLEGAFDESVLLWHLATDFCYYDTGVSHSHHGLLCTQDSCPHAYACPAWCEGSGHHKRAIQCREISNYMMYLLFVNPEMLLAGTRRNLFTSAYSELKGIIIRGDKQTHKEIELTQMIIAAVDGGGSPPPDGTQQQQGGIIRDAWNIAKVLSNLPEEKMWDVIEGVWVEMLCFSAARCRGYLHAKGLATDVEYLTYVWLLLYYMGMETLAAKLQRADHHYHNGGVHGDDPSTSRVSGAATNQEGAAGPSRSSGTYKEYAEDQSSGYQGSDATGEEIV
ncbi:hypothetical protein TRIUR3_06764 [Triticum urartu]|uniref:Uncharacterized protein n=1 Tax=Triticum urartu TaxID=4572 RepID=M7YJU6_TRIUA|nr:hypothetical protein TRIUR3_06764 [Triticum urartu]